MPHTEGGWVDVGVMKVPEGAGPANPDGIELIDLSPVDPAEDGSWSVTFQIPDEPGYHYGIMGPHGASRRARCSASCLARSAAASSRVMPCSVSSR